MKILKKLLIIFLFLILIPPLLYFFTYIDFVFSFLQKKSFPGKIIYSIKTMSDFNVKVINFPSGKKQDTYTSIPVGKEGYHYVSSFSFSQDGQKIVFSRLGTKREGRRFKLYTMNSDGTTIRELLDLENMDAKHPSFSRDSKQVAFIVQKSYDEGCLYVTNVDKPYSSLKLLSNIRPAVYKPTWSPDGKKISFISDEYIIKRISERWHSEKFVGKAFIINSDGTGLRKIETDESVSWSPDGKFLLYRGKEGYYISDENQIYKYLIIPYKRPPVKLYFNDPSFAVWSPDGKYIAYIKEIWPGLGTIGIYIVSFDNPKKQICIDIENSEIQDMVWVK